MRNSVNKALLWVTGIALVLSAGCQEQELQGEKKSRLIAAENIQLQKELEQHIKEIRSLKKQHDKEIKQLKDELTNCQKKKEALEKQLQQNVKDKVEDVLSAVLDENTKLREEIKNLKSKKR